ncbi:uncharacterized protein LOC121540216 isoform X2 [Coregonus clupeaformis]|uniref:uncharacterized protein LOC121540216 isoform X2 n=1 Tax=Coregonus clupeaformis TaxID=59861 RepID=UPI001E1C45E2|nr:uncharacterized protein LOC121540216 isoform X2 [Coregonus clupeaformis]
MGVYIPESNTSTNFTPGGDLATVHEAGAVLPGYMIVILAVLMITLVVVVVAGNALVILAFIVDKSLRNQSNYFFLNLAISDFLVGAFCIPVYIPYILTGRWVLGRGLCKLWLLMDYLLCTASVFNIVLISYDRFLSVTRAVKGSRATEGVPQIGIVITDGEANDDIQRSAYLLRKHGVSLMCLGIVGASKNEMLMITGNPENVLFIESYRDMKSSVPYVAQRLCELAEERVSSNLTVCSQGAAIDIMIILDDRSQSIMPQEFELIKDFLRSLLHCFYLGQDQVRVGLVPYSRHNDTTAFKLSTPLNNMEILKHIWNLRQSNSLTTETNPHWEMMSELLREEREGVREEWVTKVGLVIMGSELHENLSASLDELKNHGVSLYAIGGANASLMGLNKITGHRENVFFVQNFSGLTEISERISQEICSSAEDRGQQVVHMPPPGPKNSTVTDSQVTLYRGQSLSALCPYDQRYKEDVKYWCRMKGELDCATIVRTDFPLQRGDVSITDDPSQHTSTVTMQNLQTQDTGEYVCAVDNGRNPLYMASLSLTVTAGFPDVSVRSNMVSGKEGHNTTVECLYSDIMDDSEKMWCRNGTPAGNWSSCLTAEGERASQDRMDLIIDTWSRTFTVTMRHLEMNDTDWYWCIAGDQQIPVYISVLKVSNASISPPTLNLITFPLVLKLRATEDDNSSWDWERYLAILLKVAVGLVFVACTILAALVMRDYKKKNRNEL